MAIILNGINEKNKIVQVCFTEHEDEYFIQNMKNLLQKDSKYYIYTNLWDCAGDFALRLCICKAQNKIVHSTDKRMILYASDKEVEEMQYYSPDMLIMIFSKLDDWEISIKYLKNEEEKTMTTEKFHVDCPAFDDNYEYGNAKAKRDYAHPLDSTMVKFLDNKAINSVFKHLIEMVADSTYGPMVASGVPLNEKNYPEINTMINECVAELGIKRPYTIVTSHISGINAVTFGSDEEPYIAISPLMIKTMSPLQLKFVIGHECGHIAMGHVMYHTVVNLATLFAQSVPVIGRIINMVGAMPLMAWSRRSEVSADRAGLLCCGDGETAKRTLLQISMPFMDAGDINLDDYVENSQKYLENGILRKVTEINDAHPIIPKRINALNLFEKSEKYFVLTGKEIPENAISNSELESKTEDIIKIV